MSQQKPSAMWVGFDEETGESVFTALSHFYCAECGGDIFLGHDLLGDPEGPFCSECRPFTLTEQPPGPIRDLDEEDAQNEPVVVAQAIFIDTDSYHPQLNWYYIGIRVLLFSITIVWGSLLVWGAVQLVGKLLK